jgi:hypothetical protein
MSSAIRTVVWLIASLAVAPVFTAQAQTLPTIGPDYALNSHVRTGLRQASAPRAAPRRGCHDALAD